QFTTSRPSASSAAQITTRAAIARAAFPISSAVFRPRSSRGASATRAAAFLSAVRMARSPFSSPTSEQVRKGSGNEQEEGGSQEGDRRYEHRRPASCCRPLHRLSTRPPHVLRQRQEPCRQVDAALVGDRQQAV